MLGNVRGANYTLQLWTAHRNQLVEELCTGMIPERVMNVQVNMYSIYEKTGISRMDPHWLTQPLQGKYQVRWRQLYHDLEFSGL